MTTHLYLVRHAIAGARGPAWPDDSLRALTPKGAARMRLITERLADRGVSVTRVLSSPLVRARQTADIVAAAWMARPRVEVLEELAPGSTPSRVARALASLPLDGPPALVGHEPDLGRLAAWLIGADAAIPFKNGGVARVDLEGGLSAGGGRLVWLLTPKMVIDG